MALTACLPSQGRFAIPPDLYGTAVAEGSDLHHLAPARLGRQELPVSRASRNLKTDNCPYAALCRSRRNWKNSTPSRNRRFIICGLRTISPTIEAIFGARK